MTHKLFQFLSLFISLFVAVQSYAQCDETDENRVMLVGDSWAFFMGVDQTINDVFERWGHSNKTFYTNTTLAENGAETVDFLQANKQTEIEDQLNNRPSIDIVHLSIGGNDVLGSWKTSMTAAQTDSIQTQVRDSIDAVINFIKSVRPNIDVVWSGYCYSNFQEVIEGQLIPSAHPFYGTWEDMEFPDNETINQVLNGFTDMMESYYANDPQVHVTKATGMMQHTYGQIDPLEVSPFGTYPAFTAPLSEGYVDYPSPKPSMRNYGITKDCFHLSIQGYEDFISYQTQKYYHKALMSDAYFIAAEDSSTGTVGSDEVVTSDIMVGEQNGITYKSILNFETKDKLDSIVEAASIYLHRDNVVGVNPISDSMVIEIVSGSFGVSTTLDPEDFSVNGSYQGSPCIFGDNSDGNWVRLDLPGQLLPFIHPGFNTQIKISAPLITGGVVTFSDASDPEFAPVLDVTYGNQSYLGVDEITAENSFSLYPNPTSGMIHIESDSPVQRVIVLNLMGQEVLRSDSNHLSLSGQQRGTYFVKIQTKNGVMTKKVIKK